MFTPKHSKTERVCSAKQWTLLLLTATTNELFQNRSSLESGIHTYWLEGITYRLDVSVSDSGPKHYEHCSDSQTAAPFVSLVLRLDFRTETGDWVQIDADSINFVQLVKCELVPLLPPNRKRFDFSFNVSVAENKYVVAGGYLVLENEEKYWPNVIPSFYFRIFHLKKESLCVEDSSDANSEDKMSIRYTTKKRVVFEFEKDDNRFIALGPIETLMGRTSGKFITEKSEGLEVFFNRNPVLVDSATKWHFQDFVMNRPVLYRTVSVEKVETVEIAVQLK